ncbi:TerB family tellurite resistance protein [Trichloromonas sp.]|uniref:tellurite resistance TerB family protein n=1 Tax=Trichloromonas sp. TaxID=3069249 RepID=UPI003D81B7DA
MLKLLKNMLGPGAQEPTPAHRYERIQVATCALLLEMAHTDEEFHEFESALIEDLLQNRFGLPPAAVAELIELGHGERHASLDLYHFARDINEHFTIEEKVELIESLWRIVYADGLLDKYEEYLMRQVTKLLRLSHRQMIDAKLKVLAEVKVGQ